MSIAPVGLLVASIVTLLIAIGVRYAGTARIFNMVDYRRANTSEINAAVGRRLMVLPIAFLALACTASAIPSAGTFAIAASVPTVLIAAFWAASADVRS